VFDRRTLAHKTALPEESPQCFGSAGDLKAYLRKLPSGDLVIAGTNFGKNTDQGLDISAGRQWSRRESTISGREFCRRRDSW
jgi:hypothetical protein